MVLLSQELNCRVEVNADQVETTSREVFKTLENAITDYMNNTSFTDARFGDNEKIDCSLFLTVKEYGNDRLSGELQIQSTRPVYGSSYITPMVNFRDQNVQFDYRQYEPLIFSTTTMESQLTAILNFYAYLIIALDSDSFSPRGGDAAFQRVDEVVKMGQSSGETGWRRFEDSRNRSAVLAAWTEPSTSKLRDLLYTYHRNGLDEMSSGVVKARENITETLIGNLSEVYTNAPMSVGIAMFRDAKLDEIVEIYMKGTGDEKTKILKLLEEIYPTDITKIEKIRKGNN